MRRIRTLVVITSLVLCLSFGCDHRKVATDPSAPPTPTTTVSKGDQFILDVKRYGPAIVTAIEEGIKQEGLLAKDFVDETGVTHPGTINAALHKTLQPWLKGGLTAAREFVDRASHWTHFDASNKQDISKFLDDAFAFIERIYQEGVLQIKNPQAQQIASSILSGTKITLSLFKSQFLEAQQ